MKTKKLLLIALVLMLSTATTAQANDPKKEYRDQKKYQKMFCVLAGIPIPYCKGKKP
jgi:hypothetical protein